MEDMALNEPGGRISHEELLGWLREEDESRLEELWRRADEQRRVSVGEGVHLRGLIELSNHCVRRCAYCGLGADNVELERYRMSEEEVLDCAREAARFGYGTVVMQAGEDYGITRDWLAGIIRRIKAETTLAVTLSMGERPDEDLAAWRQAGADRYLLRFETSDRELYEAIHPAPPGQTSDRLALLRRLKGMGYEVGSGVLVGLPGQSYESLARDLELFAELDLDMIGIGPYIPHPATPLGAEGEARKLPPERQVPNTDLMTGKVLALARLVCPEANIPSTTALATGHRKNGENGRELGLQRGANVVMPNLTPPQYHQLYEVYPDKACAHDVAETCHGCLRMRITTLGRTLVHGPGARVHRQG